MTNPGHDEGCELSIVMPCLNEVTTLEVCIRKAQGFLERRGVGGEVVVADNGSTDGSPALAEQLGARVVAVPRRGYGAALRAGFAAARGRYVVMGDSDDSYDFSALDGFLDELRAGNDLVLGNRFRGGIAAGAMPPMHRYFGNPMLSLFARVFFRVPIGDVYCGLRGLNRRAIEQLELQSSGMEFALEMVVKASLLKMRFAEVPTTLSRDGRDRAPHLNTWRDGRRSLLLYLSSMPSGLMLYPGILMMLIGLALGSAIVVTSFTVFHVHLDVHTLLLCSVAVILGFQLVAYSVILRFLMLAARLLPPQPRFSRWVSRVRLEHVLALAVVSVTAGLGGIAWLFRFWQVQGFTDLEPFFAMRVAIPAATAITIGFQLAFAALFLSFVDWQIRSRHAG